MTELEQWADSQIEQFDTWFQSRGNEPVVRSERAILKTYLWYIANVLKVKPESFDASDKTKEGEATSG